MYQAITTFHITSDEKLVGGGMERGKQAHISTIITSLIPMLSHTVQKAGEEPGIETSYYSYINYRHDWVQWLSSN